MTIEERIIQHADDAYEAIRAINHLNGPPIPAPTVYRVLGNFYCASFSLAQALSQLGQALERSLDTYDLYEVDGGDPVETVIAARRDLDEAIVHANRLGQLLQAAQNTIAGQGHNGRKGDR